MNPFKYGNIVQDEFSPIEPLNWSELSRQWSYLQGGL